MKDLHDALQDMLEFQRCSPAQDLADTKLSFVKSLKMGIRLSSNSRAIPRSLRLFLVEV